jgi:RimJ/RimL family protein N-acetyltransferase
MPFAVDGQVVSRTERDKISTAGRIISRPTTRIALAGLSTSAKYRRQSAGQSPDGRHGWLNWMLRRLADGQLIGTVQATLSHPGEGGIEAELAWVIGSDHQGNGYGREGTLAMASWLRAHGVGGLTAHIHPQHKASIGIARALGLSATNKVSDNEVLWRDASQ